MAKFAINGFGRIGRNIVRAIYERGLENEIDIVAINDLTDAKTLAYLLKHDSIHGTFKGDVTYENAEKDADGKIVKNGSITINGKKIVILSLRDPVYPWKELGVDIVFECTGIFCKKPGAANVHLERGAKKVIISAPAKGPDKTIVMGVNDHEYDKTKHHVISNASCTTNCLAPMAKVLLNKFGIVKGLMTTIHSYTNDQRILDLPHSDLRRARAAALSMIPTTTGAAKAVGEVLPVLKGKLDGLAIRVPTPNVSVVDLTVELEKEVSVKEVNAAMKAASEGELKGILDYSEEMTVSTDYNDCPASSTFDALDTYVIADRVDDKGEKYGKMVKVMSWYDNEYGYSNRMIDLGKMIADKGV